MAPNLISPAPGRAPGPPGGSPTRRAAALTLAWAGLLAGAPAQGAAPAWDVDPQASTIAFSAVQAGARFRGRFERFDADIRFAADDLEGSRAEVSVPLRSVDSRNSDRDDEVLGEAWFDVEDHPIAVFRAGTFERLGGGRFATDATLTIKGGTHPLRFEFTVKRDGDRAVLDGSAAIDRLAMELGTGEWTDTTWVGRTIDVEVHVEAAVGD